LVKRVFYERSSDILFAGVLLAQALVVRSARGHSTSSNNAVPLVLFVA
jgi:hypothetical protein